ncbi:MAG: glycerol-3-phosphate 1-O-acyltransferase PlsY [bacterium]
MTAALLVLAAYVLGSVPTGLWLVRWVRGVDVREHGSGNIGTANVYRVAGPWLGSAVLVADVAKGAVPVLVCRTLDLPPGWAVATGVASIVGHNWSVFLGFRGGKGIATSFGVLAALSPKAAAVAAALWVTAVAVTRYASVGSVLAMLSVPVSMLLWKEPAAHLAFGVAAAVLGLVRHRSNLKRLVEGTELRITDRRKAPP